MPTSKATYRTRYSKEQGQDEMPIITNNVLPSPLFGKKENPSVLASEFKIYTHWNKTANDKYVVSIVKYKNGELFDKVTMGEMDNRKEQLDFATELSELLEVAIEREGPSNKDYKK